VSAVLRRAAAASLSLGMVTGLAACDDYTPPDEPQGATVFVLGARNNMPAMRLDGSAVDAVLRTVDEQRQASIVIADGTPTVDWSEWLVIRGGNSTARQVRLQDNQRALEDAVRAARAQDQETDLLSALSLASREAGAFEEPREIVVVDSGLSTTGPLDFTRPGMLDADPDEVVAELEAADMLPELCGITVTVQGLGDTAPPQDPLSIAQRKRVTGIWEAVLGASCADEVVVVEVPLKGEPDSSLPPVTAVLLPEPTTCDRGVVVLAGGEVAFQPDSAVLLDPSAAHDVLEPIAEQIVGRRLTATVTGTTADWGPMAGQMALSQDRAQAVVDVLVDLGVGRDQLRAEGVGSDFPAYVADGGPEGPLDPAAAAANRTVVLTPRGGTLVCD
jgi:outer membrane protein OmpA-like peptidoglycan-associated protein